MQNQIRPRVDQYVRVGVRCVKLLSQKFFVGSQRSLKMQANFVNLDCASTTLAIDWDRGIYKSTGSVPLVRKARKEKFRIESFESRSECTRYGYVTLRLWHNFAWFVLMSMRTAEYLNIVRAMFSVGIYFLDATVHNVDQAMGLIMPVICYRIHFAESGSANLVRDVFPQRFGCQPCTAKTGSFMISFSSSSARQKFYPNWLRSSICN